MNELFTKLDQISIAKAFGIGIVLGAIYWFMSDDGSALTQQIQANQQRLVSIEKDIEVEEQKVETAQKYRLTVDALGSELSSLSDFIPKDLRSTDLMKTFSTEAKAAGLDILRISEGRGMMQVEGSGLYEAFSVDVELTGTFPQHVLFLSFLSRLKTVVTVSSFRLSRDQAGGSQDGAESPQTRFTVTLLGYRYLGDQTMGGRQ